MTSPAPRPAVNVPPWHDVKQALVIAGYVFIATLLTGLIAHGLDIDHLSNAKHAAEAAIAALLAAVGFETIALVRREHREGTDPVIGQP